MSLQKSKGLQGTREGAGVLRLAIILPTYNVVSYLRECLDSLMCQTNPNFTVFAIDDGSNDGSSEILDEYAQKDSRIVVFHKKNGGVSSARNVALKMIESDGAYDYVSFIDPDDYVSPSYVEVLLRNLSQTCADYAVFSYQLFTVEGLCPHRKLAKYKLLTHEDIAEQFFCLSKDTYEEIARNSATSAAVSNRVFKVSVIRGLRFNENYRRDEDYDFFIRASLLLNTGVCIPDVLYFYRQRGSSLSKENHEHSTEVVDSLFSNRKQFTHVTQAGIQRDYIITLLRVMRDVLVGNRSFKEKYEFYKRCRRICSQDFEYPVDRSTRRKIARLKFGYVFCHLYERCREIHTRRKNIKERQKFYA